MLEVGVSIAKNKLPEIEKKRNPLTGWKEDQIIRKQPTKNALEIMEKRNPMKADDYLYAVIATAIDDGCYRLKRKKKRYTKLDIFNALRDHLNEYGPAKKKSVRKHKIQDDVS